MIHSQTAGSLLKTQPQTGEPARGARPARRRSHCVRETALDMRGKSRRWACPAGAATEPLPSIATPSPTFISAPVACGDGGGDAQVVASGCSWPVIHPMGKPLGDHWGFPLPTHSHSIPRSVGIGSFNRKPEACELASRTPSVQLLGLMGKTPCTGRIPRPARVVSAGVVRSQKLADNIFPSGNRSIVITGGCSQVVCRA